MAFVPGTRLGSYEIVGTLGAGGMATVYLARDLRHDRDVAVKVLHTEVAESLARDRFLREIRLAARLNHPHILPLYDSGEAEGLLFFVMPVMQGQTARARLDAEGQLPIELALQIAVEVADALDHAHRNDVIHRDIKPENILLHEGHAIVADFGIGKAIAAAASNGSPLTQIGVTVGTPAYMSPEQATGDSIDGRSDLFSLGCVLYEMLTGTTPFTGGTLQAVIASRLVQTPREVVDIRAAVPVSLSRTVSRLLGKSPNERPASGALVIAALRSTNVAPVASMSNKSVAVLPFANLSSAVDDEYFADGITEEIISVLAQHKELRVAARTSSFAFKGKNEDLRVIADRLGVRTVLEGSVRKAGNRLRITAQLINAADGCHLWSERFDREMTDIFALQDEIASTIGAKLEVSLRDATLTRDSRAGPRNVEAYEQLLRGRVLLAQRGPSIVRAAECFERALTLDPELAEAHALLGDSMRLFAIYGLAPTADVIPRARAAAQRALSLDPRQVEALATLANIAAVIDWDFAAGSAIADRALAIDPLHVRSIVERAFVNAYRHGASETVREQALGDLETATRIDPLNAWAAALRALSLSSTRRHAEAVAEARHAIELDPAAFTGRWSLVWTLAAMGRDVEALEAAEPALLMSGRGSRILAEVAASHCRLGNREAAEQVFQEITERARTGYVGWSEQGAIAASAGRIEEARTLVACGIEARESYVAFESCPAWGPLRADAEGRKLLDAAGP
ncbi:MAG TPA: protein kinase [Gemmatimonadaceae bacterium]|nr:protein kinase [Gemmatimonadaceae bacterium]